MARSWSPGRHSAGKRVPEARQGWTGSTGSGYTLRFRAGKRVPGAHQGWTGSTGSGYALRFRAGKRVPEAHQVGRQAADDWVDADELRGTKRREPHSGLPQRRGASSGDRVFVVPEALPRGSGHAPLDDERARVATGRSQGENGPAVELAGVALDADEPGTASEVGGCRFFA